MKATTYWRASHAANRPGLGGLSPDPEPRTLVSTRLFYYWVWQVCVAVLLLVAVEFLRRVTGPFHAYNREQFHVVRWCVGANLSAGLLVTFYARRQMWWRGLSATLISDALISLMPLIPAILAHSAGSSLRMNHAFNLGVGVFLLAQCAGLTFLSLPQCDSQARSTTKPIYLCHYLDCARHICALVQHQRSS